MQGDRGELYQRTSIAAIYMKNESWSIFGIVTRGRIKRIEKKENISLVEITKEGKFRDTKGDIRDTDMRRYT